MSSQRNQRTKWPSGWTSDGRKKKKNWRNFTWWTRSFMKRENLTGMRGPFQFGSHLFFGLFSGIYEEHFKQKFILIIILLIITGHFLNYNNYLTFWLVKCFSIYCSYLLLTCASMRIYGIALILFYIIALRAVGGVERLEMAVFQALQGKSK